MDEGEEKNADQEEDEQDEGDKRGVPGLLPMPLQARKRMDKAAKKPGVAAEHGRAAVRAALHRVVNKGMQPHKPNTGPPAPQAAPALVPQAYLPQALPMGYVMQPGMQAAQAMPYMPTMERYEKRPRVEGSGAVLPQVPRSQGAPNGGGSSAALASSNGFTAYQLPK